MDCRDFQDNLYAYVEDDLSAEAVSQVERHLKTCSQCSLFLEELRRTIALARNVEPAEPPPWLRQKVMARIREEAARKKGILQKLFFPLHIKVPLEVCATVAIALTAFYVFKTVEPELIQPSSITVPPAAVQEAKKKEALKQRQAPPETERRAETPVQAERKPAEEERAPVAAIGEGYMSKHEEETVRQEPSGAADMRVRKEVRSMAPSAVMKEAQEGVQGLLLTLFVKDTLNVGEEIERTIRKLGGSIIRSEAAGNKRFFTVTLSSDKVKDMTEALKLLGELEGEASFSYVDGDVEIGITVVKTEVRLH